MNASSEAPPGVSGEAEYEQFVRGSFGGSRARRSEISESEALSRGLGRDGAVGTLIPRLQGPSPDSPRRFVLVAGVRQHNGR